MDDLTECNVSPEPIEQFSSWFQEAVEAELPQPDAMALATVGPDGRPSARMVLLKRYDARGFVFFTNYSSRKAAEMAGNRAAALLFFWVELHRQIRIEGDVEIVSHEESDAYFATRPRGSQTAAWASRQSSVLPGRDALERRVRAVEHEFAGQEVPRPAFWGGYRVVPHTLEFWQGRPDRLHDRLRYRRRDDGSWILERLAP